MDQLILEVRAWIAEAERVVVLTGAGISTDSGIPDFRGPSGTWTTDPDAEKMSTLQTYVADPQVRKASWRNRLESPAWTARPNRGHHALVALEKTGKLHTIVTQNIDELHQQAGSDPELVVEIHGTMRQVVCLQCDERAPMEKALERVRGGEDDPACRTCGGILKSATISFGQSLVAADLRRAERAASECDVFLAIGTSLSVFPVSDLVPIAAGAGAKVVILNNEPTQHDRLADAVIRGSISSVLPQLVGLP